MSEPRPRQPGKRKLLRLMTLLPLMVGCTDEAQSGGAASLRRFKDIGVVLVVDAVPGAELEGVVFYDDRGLAIYSSSVVARRNREIMALGGARVPMTVRVIWRDHPTPIWGNGGIDYEGTIAGDYKLAIAERIPDEVLASIRKKGGALRLKFRLKPDGVLFGWDIERHGRGISDFDMPGGDFLDTRY